MLAKATRDLPDGEFLYEPKWDGFRCLVFRDGDEVELGSRNEQPLTRYFPELIDPIRESTPPAVRRRRRARGRHARRPRLRPAQPAHPSGREPGQPLAAETPGEPRGLRPPRPRRRSTSGPVLSARRDTLESAAGGVRPPLHLTPATDDPALAADWFERFEGAGFDGVMAKAIDGAYVEDKRAQLKVKHHRTADCVVAGYRHAQGRRGRLAAARPVRRGRRRRIPLDCTTSACAAPSRPAQRTNARRRARPVRGGRLRRPSVGRVGRTGRPRGRRSADAGRAEPVDRGNEPRLGARCGASSWSR